jgi:hypothetical protein
MNSLTEVVKEGFRNGFYWSEPARHGCHAQTTRSATTRPNHIRPHLIPNGSAAIVKKFRVKKSQRKLIVFSTLLGVLSLTSALLMALAPAPLVPDAATSLFAVDEPRSLDAVFATKTPVPANRWKYIFIHHSQSASGNALTLSQANDGMSDHFLIGNGDGCMDGEIQISQRWNQQQLALPPVGAKAIDPACISICLVGDFDKTIPTPTQLRRLNQLVATLQSQLHIDKNNVLLIDSPPPSPASTGRYFPKAAFRGQLLP